MSQANPLINKAKLKARIIRSLRGQGFRVIDGNILPPKRLSKRKIRRLHETAVEHRIERARAGLVDHEPKLLECIASGCDVVPEKIRPRMVEVRRNSHEELVFRYASLHWSIPTSSGYGRRLRFLVIDEYNGKLIGIIGLADPVISLAARDQWIGWDNSNRNDRLKNVMDAFVLGAVPPYSFLLGGKLIAMLATSDTVRNLFKQKYGGKYSLIRGVEHDGRLAMVTTTSALGRSSIYNRLRLGREPIFEGVGFTKGSGEFHFSNGLYGAISTYAERYCEPSYRKEEWGAGFRNKREVIKKCLPKLGLSSEWIYHGIEREVFIACLAQNSREFLRGEHSRLLWHHRSENELFEFFRERWLLPRASRDDRFLQWSRNRWAIWMNRK